MQLIRASIEFGVRPSALILGTDSRKPWGKWDLLLAQAYQQFQDERCSQCGYPRWICQNESEDIYFEIEEEVCEAAKAEEYYRNPPRSKKPKDIGPGVALRPIAKTQSGTPLGDFREPFFEALAKKRAPSE